MFNFNEELYTSIKSNSKEPGFCVDSKHYYMYDSAANPCELY